MCLRRALATHRVLTAVCVNVFVLLVCLLEFISVPEECAVPAKLLWQGNGGEPASTLWHTHVLSESLNSQKVCWRLWSCWPPLWRNRCFYRSSPMTELFTGSSKKCLFMISHILVWMYPRVCGNTWPRVLKNWNACECYPGNEGTRQNRYPGLTTSWIARFLWVHCRTVETHWWWFYFGISIILVKIRSFWVIWTTTFVSDCTCIF